MWIFTFAIDVLITRFIIFSVGSILQYTHTKKKKEKKEASSVCACNHINSREQAGALKA